MPLQAFGETPPDSQQLSLLWNNGGLNVDLTQLDSETSTLLRQLRGARLITDLDGTYSSSNEATCAQMRKLSEIYQLSSKAKCPLVAVFKRPDDDPLQVPLTRPLDSGLLPASPEITNPIYRGPSRPTAARPRMPLPMSLPPHPATGVYQLFASSALTPPPASLDRTLSLKPSPC